MDDARTTEGFMSMKGGGYYSKATIGAKHVIDNAAHLIFDSLARMNPKDDGTTFTLADMGCADGGTSISTIGEILKFIRKKTPSRPIQMVYTDLTKNDVSQVFQNVHGQTDLNTYIEDIDDLYVFSSATPFHKLIFPAGSLNLGISATASRYVSEQPCIISDHIHMVGSTGEERAAYQEQGRLDLERMLLNRARELAPTGRLALFIFGIDEKGRYLGSIGGVNMFETFNLLWKSLINDGIISEEEYLNTNFPQSYRTVEEFTAPLDDNSCVYKAGLRIEHVETRVVTCPFAEDVKRHGDSVKFVKEYIPTLRFWSEATFANGLSDRRSPDEQRKILDNLYGKYQYLVEESPAGHGMDYVHCYLIIRKDF